MPIFDELKSVAKTLRDADKLEQYQQILDAQQQLLAMQEEIASLKAENSELRDKLSERDSLIFEDNAYYKEVQGQEKEGPFCSKCYDSDSKLIRMRVYDVVGGWAFCPNCKKPTPRSI